MAPGAGQQRANLPTRTGQSARTDGGRALGTQVALPVTRNTVCYYPIIDRDTYFSGKQFYYVLTRAVLRFLMELTHQSRNLAGATERSIQDERARRALIPSETYN